MQYVCRFDFVFISLLLFSYSPMMFCHGVCTRALEMSYLLDACNRMIINIQNWTKSNKIASLLIHLGRYLEGLLFIFSFDSRSLVAGWRYVCQHNVVFLSVRACLSPSSLRSNKWMCTTNTIAGVELVFICDYYYLHTWRCYFISH